MLAVPEYPPERRRCRPAASSSPPRPPWPPPRFQAADTPRRGAFVAVGYGGRRLYSADGVAWEIAAEWQANGGDDSNNLMGLTFGKGNFVAVGGGGAGKTGGGHILVSSDGKAWREVKSFSSRVNPVLFGDGRFVAGGPDRRLLWSDDAETWHDGPAIGNTAASHFRHGAAGNGRFLFVGNGRKPTSKTESTEIHWAVSSRDGTAVESEIDDLAPGSRSGVRQRPLRARRPGRVPGQFRRRPGLVPPGRRGGHRPDLGRLDGASNFWPAATRPPSSRPTG